MSVDRVDTIGLVPFGSCSGVLRVHAVHEDPENADEHRMRVSAGNRDSSLAGGSDLGCHRAVVK